jgi:hypothetical protein
MASLPLRQRMIDNMKVRDISALTQAAYVRTVTNFAAFHVKSPDTRSFEHEGIRRTGRVCAAVRDTAGTDTKNPFGFEYVRARIEHALREFEGRFLVVPVPNITQCSTVAM